MERREETAGRNRESEFNFCVMMAVAAAAVGQPALTHVASKGEGSRGWNNDGGREGEDEGRMEISLKFATTKSFALPPSLSLQLQSLPIHPPSSSFILCGLFDFPIPSLAPRRIVSPPPQVRPQVRPRILHFQIKAWAGSFQVQFVRYARGNQR